MAAILQCMAIGDPSWDLYRTFLAVLREGSLSAAARHLGLAQPTVGRHVDALEQAVGQQLFTRSLHGLMPTPAALELGPYAETLQATASALLRAASASVAEVAGTVRVTASEVIGVEVLPPILAALQETHPGLTIEIVLSNAVEDLLRRDADIAVRMVAPMQEALVAQRVGFVPLGLHARRDYLERHGVPHTPADLERHRLIGFDRETAIVRRFMAGAAAQGLAGFTRARFALRTDNDLAQLALIRAGAGIGFCQLAVARRSPELVRILPEVNGLVLDTWVAMHENLRRSPRCRVVFDALVAGLRRHVAAGEDNAAGEAG